MHKLTCDACKEAVPAYDLIHYGSIESGYRDLCSRCFNNEVAERMGRTDFAHHRFEPIEMRDRAGNRHTFHFKSCLLGDRLALDAFEVVEEEGPSGYQFQILGSPDEDTLALLGRLIEKIRRALATQYLTEDNLGLQIADLSVRGRIEWDAESDGQVPLLVVDGREVSWEDFGRMLMAFEGWQFRMEIVDRSEEA